MAALFLLLFVLPPVSPLSQSKLSVHSGPYDGDATSQLVSSGKPRIIKLLDSFGNVEKYKSMDPGIIVIGRVYLPTQPQSGDPKEVGRGGQWFSFLPLPPSLPLSLPPSLIPAFLSFLSSLSPLSLPPPQGGRVVVGPGEQVHPCQPVCGLLGGLQ